MSERIKCVQSPTLIVNSAGNGFDEITNAMWGWVSSTGAIITPYIDGEILKVAINFGSSNADESADLTIATRDTPTESIIAITSTTWKTDLTLYPRLAIKSNANASVAWGVDTAETSWGTATLYDKYVVKGSLTIDCANATDNDTVIIKIYYR